MATFALSSLTVPAMRKSYVAALAIDIASGRDGAKPNRMREREGQRPEGRGLCSLHSHCMALNKKGAFIYDFLMGNPGIL